MLRMSPTAWLRFVVVTTGAVALGGCTSPREKDCKKVTPLLEESKIGRAVGVMDGGLQPTFADRPQRTASGLRTLVLDDPQIKSAATGLADANDRFAAAMTGLDQLVTAMKMKPGASAPFGANMLDTVRPHVEHLLRRCGVVMRTQAQGALPECTGLERALEQCVNPAADDTTAEEQLLTCATAIGKVRSEDGATNSAIQQLATTLRDFEPVARNVGASAKEVIRAARQHGSEISKQSVTRAEVENAEGALRELCLRAGGRS